jgi:hypothetical protein
LAPSIRNAGLENVQDEKAKILLFSTKNVWPLLTISEPSLQCRLCTYIHIRFAGWYICISKSQFGYILMVLGIKNVDIFDINLVIFTTNCYIVWIFGIFCGDLVYFYRFTTNNLATLLHMAPFVSSIFSISSWPQ